MATPQKDSSISVQLRKLAEQQLEGGTAPSTKGWYSSAQALAMLHRLASDPASAADALKLLHELQVHQVELDLQHEQIEQERGLYAESLEAYVDLFDAAPFVYLTLDREGKLQDASRVGAKWLGGPREQWLRRQVWVFFAPESRAAIQDALSRLQTGSASVTFMARPVAGGVGLQVTAAIAHNSSTVLLAFMPVTATHSSI